MEGSYEKGFSPSSTRSKSPSANPRFSHTVDAGEVDENELSYNRIVSKNKYPKKPPVKHFMSPTISASSKAAIPRKKILTERNESSNSSESHHEDTSVVHRQNSSSRSFFRKTVSHNRGLTSDDDEQNSYSSDSLSKPYDPLTNYLSPRPKFLRFNPTRNRYRETFVQQEDEFEKESDVSDVQSSSDPSSEESPAKKKNAEVENIEIDDLDLDDDEEDIENSDSASCLSIKGALKLLLVSVVLVLLTWRISSMNSLAPQNDMNIMLNSTDRSFNRHYLSYDDFVDVNNRKELIQCVDEKQKEINEVFDHVLVDGGEVCLETGVDVNEDGFCDRFNDVKEEVEDVFDNDQVKEIESSETGGDQTTPISDLVNSYVSEEEAEDDGLGKETEGCDHMKEIESSETADNSEPFEEDQNPSVSDLKDICFSENGMKVSKDSEVKTRDDIKTAEGLYIEEDEKVEENKMERVGLSSTGHSGKELIIYGFFVGSLFLAFYYVMHKRTPPKKSRTIKKPLYDTSSAEKISSENPILSSLEETTHIEKVETLVNSSLHFPLVDEHRKDFAQSRAPTVELLGEFVVGDVRRSSMKGCSTKSKSVDIEVENKEMEFVGDSNSIYLDKGVQRKVNLSTPEFSASTNMDSPSYGSFTAEKKIARKEEGSAVATTPVRRSSRIRKRAMSP